MLPYCTESEKKLLSSFHQMTNMMQMMDGIKEYLPMIQQLMSSGANTGDSCDNISGFGGINMMDMLKNMLSEEQLAMFSMFMDQDSL